MSVDIRLPPVPLAEAPALRIQEDAKGKFVMLDGRRIPVRNGGPLVDPLTDWQIAREIEQEIETGDGIDAQPIGLRNIFGAVWSISTSAGGWTTYTLTPEPHVALWLAGQVLVLLPVAVWTAFAAHWFTLPLGALYLVFTWFCDRLGGPPR